MRKHQVFSVAILSTAIFGFCISDTENDLTSIEKTLITKSKIMEAKAFAIQNKMDTTVAIFVDFSIPSGKYRMFVWDYTQTRIVKSVLCAHGSGNSSFVSDDKVVFSNVPESHYSSKGKYKIGSRGWSNWGIHVNYKLHGLESTNNNAFKRIIVLHSYDMVEDAEIYPEELVNSWGCPMVSNNSMKYLDEVLKEAKQPVLLWVY